VTDEPFAHVPVERAQQKRRRVPVHVLDQRQHRVAGLRVVAAAGQRLQRRARREPVVAAREREQRAVGKLGERGDDGLERLRGEQRRPAPRALGQRAQRRERREHRIVHDSPASSS
jgi:hypothetical protein